MDPTPELVELLERMEHLEVQVRRLEEALDDPPAPLVAELRARRLVVVDDEGEERVVIDTVAGTGSVLVRVPGPAGGTTGVELFASPADEGEGPVPGVCVLRAGEVVAWWPPT